MSQEQEGGQEDAESGGQRQTAGRLRKWKEDRATFQRRIREKMGRGGQEGYRLSQIGQMAYGYRRCTRPHPHALDVQEELRRLGIDSFIHEGELEVNSRGETKEAGDQATTIGKQIVGIHNGISLEARDAAGHEAFHIWIQTEAGQAYQDWLQGEIVYTSEAFLAYQKEIADAYFESDEGIDPTEEYQWNQFAEELFAYLSGQLHAGETEQIAKFLQDVEKAKEAWAELTRRAPKERAARKEQEGGKNGRKEEVSVRQGGQRPDGADTGREVHPVEEGAGEGGEADLQTVKQIRAYMDRKSQRRPWG